jgi:alkylhydroperoxidase/carboxymuconolactone decarboxylase family protein YurZ
MSTKEIPNHYESLKARFPRTMEAIENLGGTVRDEGPLEKKVGHLVKMAAAAVSNSEGAVHSHARRALEAGATRDEVYHALLILVSTIGFPKVAAAISWVDDVVEGR